MGLLHNCDRMSARERICRNLEIVARRHEKRKGRRRHAGGYRRRILDDKAHIEIHITLSPSSHAKSHDIHIRIS